jgi:hypothetical protein
MNILATKVYADSLSDRLGEVATSEGGLFSGMISGNNALGDVTSAILNIAIPLAGIAAVVLIVVASYKMISSQGNPEKLKDAKDMITNAIIGLVFILLSVSILLLVSNIFELGVGG